MRIIFTGDLFLGGDLSGKDAADIIKVSAFNCADKRIVNLEQPISDNEYVEDKCTIYTGSFATKQLKQLKVDTVNLAHNHIQDKGDAGIIETILHLERADIGHFGAGETIEEARKPYWIDSKIAIIGYCEFGKPYMRQIRLAGEKEPGVNPLRFEMISSDLEALPKDTRAILYFHWGREHVWLPPDDDILLAKRLLEHEKVICIIGGHAHRAQGYIEHDGKRAYMCLGNFLFPNIYISPPTKICYPDNPPEKCLITRQYHSVFDITYKKWRLANRISLGLQFDTKSKKFIHFPMIQDDNIPQVKEMKGLCAGVFLLWIDCLSIIYKLPLKVYRPLEKASTFLTYKFWRIGIYLFWIRQKGLKWIIGKILGKMKIRITNKL